MSILRYFDTSILQYFDTMKDIQWFPGHMAKTERELMECVKLADFVIDVLDARIPSSSANPDFEKIFAGRKRLTVLNKSDLADPACSEKWKLHFRSQGIESIFTNSQKGDGISRIRAYMQKVSADKISKQAERGVKSRPLRAIVAGIPNSGKSSLINILASKATAATGDRPGITKRRQWIRLGGGIELLDTPGVLWPKIISADVALRLAFTGAIRDEVYDTIDVAEKLLTFLCSKYMPLVIKRYGDISVPAADDSINAYPLLTKTGVKRGFLSKGGIVDYERAAAIVLDEFRAARIGRITLEEPSIDAIGPVT